jgi:NTE family protein
LGLTFGGGGARAAYQVGVLRSVAKAFPDLRVPVLTGVSAGAINAAHLANRFEPFAESVRQLETLWRGITIDQVFRTDFAALGCNMLRWALRLVSGGKRFPLTSPARGLVDTAPLKAFLSRSLRTDERGVLTGIDENIERGRLSAVGISTTNYATGQSVSWVQGRGIDPWRRPGRMSALAVLTVDHIMASCALPLFFPAVQLGPHWHGDGGVKLTAPLSPALHLGAGRILALSTRYQPAQAEADSVTPQGYPPPATVIGLLFDAIFLDMLDADAHAMQRLNGLVDALPGDVSPDLRRVDLLLIRPSVDLAAIATEYESGLPRSFRFATRGLGTRETKHADLLATVLFQPRYIARMIEIGERDGDSRRDEIEAFLSG